MPHLLIEFKFQTVEEGATAEFICSLLNISKDAKVTWYKNNSVITSTSNTSTSFNGQIAKLVIKSTKKIHSSTYRVIIKNEYGEDESSAKLVVQGNL